MITDHHDYFLAVAGAIPIFLLVATVDRKLKFKREKLIGRLCWIFLIGALVAGEVGALGALASPAPDRFEAILSGVGVFSALAIVLLLFTWQLFEESAGKHRPVTAEWIAIFLVLAGLAVAVGVALIRPLV